MAALTHSESKSWGLEKFNPKNSKWLQSNISDTEGKVKAMIKILEEDADSFGKRAEMYYKRRPELMNLVKEFYGAYRSLAEKYDVAAGALRQAQLSSDEPPSEPQTPDSHSSPGVRFSLGNEDSPSPSPNGKKVFRFKQDVKTEQEVLALKGRLLELSFEKDELGERVGELEREVEERERELEMLRGESERVREIEREVKEREGELERLRGENERLIGIEREVEEREKELKRLKSEKQRSNEDKLMELELLEKKVVLEEMEIEELNWKLGEIEMIKVELKRENEGLIEKNSMSEITVRKLQSKIGELEGKLEIMKLEIGKMKKENGILSQKLEEKTEQLEEKTEELEEKRVECVINENNVRDLSEKLREKTEECEISKNNVRNLSEKLREKTEQYEMIRNNVRELVSEKEMILGGLNNLKLELAIKTDELINLERMNYKQEDELETLQNQIRSQEEFNHGLMKEIGYLKQQKIQSEERILNLTKDLSIFNELKGKLEKEIQIHLREKETLEKNLSIQIKDTFDLANRLKNLTNQTEQAIRANTILKEASTKYEIERGILFEKNVVLERELENLNVELMIFRERSNDLEISEDGLKNEIMVLEREKKEFELKFGEIKEKNSDLESNLSNLISEFDDLFNKLRKSEENSSDLITEKTNLFSQVEKLKEKMRNLEENNSQLATERDLMENDLMDLKELLSSKNQEFQGQISEKLMLNSQIENLIKRIEEFNSQFENLREELKESEAQKSNLFSEKDELLLKVERMRAIITNLEEKEKDLEETYSNIIKEKISMEKRIKELESILNSKNEEHEFNSISSQKEISYLNLEIENLREKLKEFEAIKSAFISENIDLKSQVEYLMREEELREKRVKEIEDILICKTQQLEFNSNLFQDQISKFNFETENLRGKLKESEKSCKSLLQQKWNLLSEKDDLFSEVEKIRNDLKNLEEKHSELEGKNWELSYEKDLMQNQYIIHLNNLNDSINQTTIQNNFEIQNFTEKLKESQIEISGYKSEKNSLETKIIKLSCIIDEIKTRNDELNNSLSDLNSQIWNLNSKLKESEEDKSDLINEKNNLLSKVENLKIIIKNFEEKHNELEEKHSSLSKERDLNQNEFKKLEKILTFKTEEHKSEIENRISMHNSERENLQNKNSELEILVSNLNSNLKDLNEQKSLLIAQKDDLSSQLNSVNIMIKKLESKHEDLIENHSILIKERDLMHIHLNEYLFKNSQLNSKLNQSQKYCESLNQQKNDLSTQMHSMNIILKNLESKNEDLEEDYLIIRKERDLMQIQLNELNNYSRAKIEDYLNKINEISGKNYELENLVSNLNSQIGDLNSTKSDLSSKVYSLETIFKNLESKHENLEENYSIISKEKDLMQIELNDLNNYFRLKIREYSNKIDDISAKNSEFVLNLNDQIKDSNSKISLLIAEKNDLSLQLYSVKTIFKNLESKNEDLEENYSIICKEKDLMQIQLNDLNNYLKAKNEEYSNKIGDLNSQKCLLIAQKDDLSSKLYSMEILMKNLESKHEDLEENYYIISKERDLMKIELNDLNDFLHLKNQEYLSTIKSHDLDILSHISNIKTLQNSIHEFSEKNTKLENYLSNIHQEKDALFSQVEKLEDKHFKLETKHKTLEKERELMQNQMKNLQNQTNILQNQINNLRKDLEKEQEKNSNNSNHLFILERSLSDMVDQHFQASLLTEQVIFQLEKEERQNQGLRIQIEDLNIQNEIEMLVLNVVLRDFGFDLEEMKLVNGDLERENGEIEDLNNCLNIEREVLNVVLRDLGFDLEELKFVNGNLERENKDLKLQKEKNEDFNNCLNIEISVLNTILRDLGFDLEELKLLNGDLKREIEGLNANLAFLKYKLVKNEEIRKELEMENNELIKELLISENSKLLFENLCNERGTLLQNFNNELTFLNSNKLELIEKVDFFQGENKTLKEEFKSNLIISQFDLNHVKNLNRELILQIEGVQFENNNLGKNIEKCEKYISCLMNEIISLQINCTVFEENIFDLNVQNESLFAKDKFIEGLNVKLTKLEDHNAKLILGLKESNNREISFFDQPESSSKLKYFNNNNNNSPIINMKDIELDKIYNNEIKEIEDPMLHLWEENPRKSSSVNREIDLCLIQEIKTEQNRDLKKVLERLNLDSERLSVLKSGIEELKQKLDGKLKLNENNNNEYNEIKFQVYETEKILNKQLEINTKAMKNAQYYENNLSSNLNLNEEERNERKKKIEEVSEKGREKVGKLELEFEKVKYVVQRLEDTWHERREKGGEREKRVRVLLRDYIYGRRKKMPLCGCIRSNDQT